MLLFEEGEKFGTFGQIFTLAVFLGGGEICHPLIKYGALCHPHKIGLKVCCPSIDELKVSNISSQ